MKKKIFWVILIIFVLLIGLKLITIFGDLGVEDYGYSYADLPEPDFSKGNGFYQIWTLNDPENIDIKSDKIINKFRNRLKDSKENSNKWYGEYNKKRNKFVKFLKMKFPYIADVNLNYFTEKFIEDIKKIDEEYRFLYLRYEELIKTEIIDDFSDPDLIDEDRRNNYDGSLCPDLWLFIRLSNFYTAKNVINAIDEGNWDLAIENLIYQLNFSKKLIKSSRVLITNVIAKGIFKMSVYAMSNLMNHKDCPEHIYKYVLTKLEVPLVYSDYGTKIAFIAEYLTFEGYINNRLYMVEDKIAWIPIFLFLKKNETKKYMYETIKKLIEFEEIPPYKRERNYGDIRYLQWEKTFLDQCKTFFLVILLDIIFI